MEKMHMKEAKKMKEAKEEMKRKMKTRLQRPRKVQYATRTFALAHSVVEGAYFDRETPQKEAPGASSRPCCVS